MTSLSFYLCKWRGVFKEECMSPGVGCQFVWFSFRFFLWFVLRKPQTLCLGYLGASWGVGLFPYRKVFFICLTVCVQGYPEHLELMCFNSLWVSQVACHPVHIWPDTRKARTAAPSEWSSACGINCNLGEPTKFIQHPQRVTYIC